MTQSDHPAGSDPSDFALPDNVRDARVRLFFEYWTSKCRPGRLPCRSDIDPNEMVAFLPYVILLDVERGPARFRFRYRLVGTEVVSLFGYDPTGRYLDEATSPQRYPQVHARLLSVAETKRPHYAILPVPLPNRDSVYAEILTVPMASDGDLVDLLLGVRCGLTQKQTPSVRMRRP
jgi:hypothetical protein